MAAAITSVDSDDGSDDHTRDTGRNQNVSDSATISGPIDEEKRGENSDSEQRQNCWEFHGASFCRKDL